MTRSTVGIITATVALLVSGAALYGTNLDTPPKEFTDEIWYVPDARYHATGEGELENFEHPPLGKLIMGASVAALGDRPTAWRAPGVISTLLMLGLLGGLAVRWFGWIGLIAPLFVLLDPVVLTSTRLATIDAQMTLWLVAGAGTMVVAFESRPASIKWLAVSGAILGTAMAIKWTAITVIPGFALIGLASVEDFSKVDIDWRRAAAAAAPGAIAYTLAYLVSGHGPLEMIEMQSKMVSYHTGYYPLRSQRSHWWQWFVMLEPFWYFLPDEQPLRLIAAIGTPLWLIGGLCIVGAGYVGIHRIRSGPQDAHQDARRARLVPLSLFIFVAMQLGLWTIAARATFIYYMSAISPFLALAFAWSLHELLGAGKRVVAVGLAASATAIGIGWFAFVLPLCTAQPLDDAAVDRYFRGPTSRVIVHRGQSLEHWRGRFRHEGFQEK